MKRFGFGLFERVSQTVVVRFGEGQWLSFLVDESENLVLSGGVREFVSGRLRSKKICNFCCKDLSIFLMGEISL
jgi:hypothetical protein